MATNGFVVQLSAGPVQADVYAGPRETSPAVLVHGWGGSGHYWQWAARHLSAKRSVIVPDMPGCGRSVPVREPAGMVAWCDTLDAISARLDHRPIDLIGHSLGSGVAIAWAAANPTRVRRLILTSISLFRSESERHAFGTAMDVVARALALRAPWMADLPGFCQLFARRVFAQVPNNPPLLRRLLLDYLTMDGPSAARCLRDSGSRLVLDAAPRVRTPTLLVVSREDKLMPQANVPLTAAMIPGCQTHWMGRCGHLPMVERAADYVAVVEGFLAL